jgi:hypothetical protein
MATVQPQSVMEKTVIGGRAAQLQKRMDNTRIGKGAGCTRKELLRGTTMVHQKMDQAHFELTDVRRPDKEDV